MDKAEAILKECLEGLLEEEIKAIPSEAELKKQHKFSKQFINNMNKLIKENKRKNMFRIYKALGACAAVIVLGVLAVNGLSLYRSGENSVVYEEATKEAAEMATETTGNDAEDASDGEMKSSVFLGVKSGYGDEVNVADLEAEPVGLKVFANYQQEDGWILYLQLQNNTENSVQIMEGSYMLEVWQEDGWYVIETKEEGQEYELATGNSYAGDIVLENDLYGENQYRLLLMIDDEMKGYVFSPE